MSKEYIERETALKVLDSLHADIKLAMLGVYKAIDSIPAVDVAPVVHGEWIIHGVDENSDLTILKCSNCGRKQFGCSNYCSGCSAKMDGGSK